MRVLITGITGFVGSHMAELALAKGAQVFGSWRWRSNTEHIEHLRSRITLIESDLRDASSVRTLVEKAAPDYVIHLAAQSFVGTSWQAPSETFTTNVFSQMHLLEAIRDLRLSPRFLAAGSSEEYGLVHEDELPICETNPLRPLSPYAVSKIAQDMMGYQYFKSYGLPIVRTRAFNHSVSRHTPVLVRDDRADLVDIRYIGEIRRPGPAGCPEGGAAGVGGTIWDMRAHHLSVWADGEWTKIIHLSCHSLRPEHRVLRVVSPGGIVEVTGDHSVMAPGPGGHVAVAARDLAAGGRVALVDLPRCDRMWVHEDVAWFMGLFAARGRIGRGTVRIDSTDRKLLDRCAEVLLRHFGLDARCLRTEGGTWRLAVREARAFARWLRPQVRASDGNARVPRSILNAQADAKLAFLWGYDEGAGLRARQGPEELARFETRSPILVLGLCYLVANTTRQGLRLDAKACPGGPSYRVTLDPRQEAPGGRRAEIDPDVISKIEPVPYEGEVWDFETEHHVFHAGLGRNLVHNTGPRRGDVFVESTFARQIAEIEAGLCAPILHVGDLNPRRDYSDVRDIVRGYWLLVERGEPGEVYNLCSGRSLAIRDVLHQLLGASRVGGIEVQVDPARLRPSDVMVLQGDPSKVERATGWRAEIPLERTLGDLLEYWRARVRVQGR